MSANAGPQPIRFTEWKHKPGTARGAKGTRPMKFDMQLMFIMVGVGLASRRISGKGWLALCATLVLFLFYNLQKG